MIDQFGCLDIGVVASEPEAPALEASRHEFVKAWFVDRQIASLQALDTSGIDVQTDDLVAQMSQTGRGHEADIAGTDDGELHRARLSELARNHTVTDACGA